MQNIEEYKTIRSSFETTLKEKSSIFIAHAYPVENEAETSVILEQARKKYFDAAHHCYAYKILSDLIKYSDNGEPSGTAGARILNAINHFNLFNILVIVTRYFGGTKLGVGLLGKAYYNSAFMVMESSRIIIKTGYKKILIKTEMNQINIIYHLLNLAGGKINKSNFEDFVEIECAIPCREVEEFKSALKEISKGKAEIKDDEIIIFI
jgi:uncharacterized YigZ family protein